MKFLLFLRQFLVKMGLEIGLYYKMKYFKASDAFILPYKYSLLFLAKWMDGEILSPNPIKNFEKKWFNLIGCPLRLNHTVC